MKQLIIILIILVIAFLFGCAPKYYCQPQKGSKDYAVKKIDGNTVTLVRFERGLRIKQTVICDHVPDTLKVGDRVAL